MDFIDPYLLFLQPIADPQAVTDAVLQAAKLHLKSLPLVPRTSEVLIAGKTIDKSVAERLLAEMSDPVARQRFWEMRLVGGLIPFLEEGTATALQSLLVRCQATGVDFHAFASRWLALKVDAMLREALRKNKWPDAVMLARGIAKLHPLSEQVATAGARRFFTERQQDLEKRTQNPMFFLTEAEIKPFCLSAMLGVLNSLPDGCQGLRDDYANALGGAVMATAKAHLNQPWTYAIAQSVSQIKVSVALKNKVQFMIQGVKDDSGITEHEIRQARRARWAAIGGALIALLIGLLKIILNFIK